ncbi:hypothetical protein [Dokdonia sp.]|uniref:hypothetical protein n=1 Tax=Dokdonia sp. TaxID=2024995 RepID=UPI00326559CA
MARSSKIADILIANDDEQFRLNSWDECQFVNTGTCDVTVMGLPLKPLSTVRFGGNGNVLNDTVSIVFDKSKKGLKKELRCVYEVSHYISEEC